MTGGLYDRAVLRLAAASADWPPLAAPAHRATRTSRVCGSTVTVDLDLDGEGRIGAIGLSLHACALGQASAAVLARHAAGQDAGAIEAALGDLRAMLTAPGSADGDAAIDPVWPELATLAVGRDYPARHGAILLPFETALAALAS